MFWRYSIMAPSCRCAPLRVFYVPFTTACNAEIDLACVCMSTLLLYWAIRFWSYLVFGNYWCSLLIGNGGHCDGGFEEKIVRESVKVWNTMKTLQLNMVTRVFQCVMTTSEHDGIYSYNKYTKNLCKRTVFYFNLSSKAWSYTFTMCICGDCLCQRNIGWESLSRAHTGAGHPTSAALITGRQGRRSIYRDRNRLHV